MWLYIGFLMIVVWVVPLYLQIMIAAGLGCFFAFSDFDGERRS